MSDGSKTATTWAPPPTATEAMVQQERERVMRDMMLGHPNITAEQKIAGVRALGITPSFVDAALGPRKQYGHHPDTVARAKGTLELYTLEERRNMVWDVKPVTIALGVGAMDS